MEKKTKIIIVAVCLSVLSLIIVSFVYIKARQSIDFLIPCEDQGGHCESVVKGCSDDERSIPEFGGCGSKGRENKPLCCLPKT